MTALACQPVPHGGRLYERIVDHIIRLIVERALQPGDRLPPEQELARLLGISRSSLREALTVLEALGHVEVRHGRGVTLRCADVLCDSPRAWLDGNEVGLGQLFAMREVLEVPAAGWAASKRELVHVAGLEATLAELAAQAALVPADLASVHASFHFQVNDIAANRFLARAMGVLYDMLDTGLEATLCLTGRLERSAEVHRRITEAIAAGDSDAARPAMRAHILGSRSVAVRRLRDQGTKP